MYQHFNQSEARQYIPRRLRAQLHEGPLRCRFTVLSGAASIEGSREEIPERLRWRLRNDHRQRYRLTIGSSGP
jgi:hypothetical protein